MSGWKKVETGVDEKGEKTFEYQFGGDIDGVFVPAVTKSAGYIEHLAERAAESQQAAQSEQSASGDKGDES